MQGELTYGQNGFMQQKGSNAVNQPLLKNYLGQMDQAAASISAGLDNNYQRTLFARRAAMSRTEMATQIVNHVAQQSDVYAKDVFTSTVDTEAQAAANNWGDPTAPLIPIQRINAAIDSYAQRTGASDEWITDTKAKAQSEVYSGIVKQALAVDAHRASGLLATYGDKILPTQRAQLDMTIQSKAYTQDMRETMAAQRAEITAERNMRLGQASQESKLLADVLDGKGPDSGTLATMVRTQRISAGGMAAILNLETRGEGLPDNTPVALDLFKKFADGTLTTDEVYQDARDGHLKMSTARTLLGGLAAREKTADSAIIREARSSVMAAAGVPDGMLNISGDLAARKAQAEREWTDRIYVQHQDPLQVRDDMMRKYQPAGVPPLTWNQPAMGAIHGPQDVRGVWQATKQAHDAGQMSDADFNAQAQVILQYQRFFDAQTAARAARPSAQSGDRAQLRGVVGQQPAMGTQ